MFSGSGLLNNIGRVLGFANCVPSMDRHQPNQALVEVLDNEATEATNGVAADGASQDTEGKLYGGKSTEALSSFIST